jgi:hypothetical protein
MENANLFMEIGPENSKRIVWMIPNETAQMNDLACMKMTPPPVAMVSLKFSGPLSRKTLAFSIQAL